MHIGETIPGRVEGPPLEDVVVLVDGNGAAVGVERAVRRMSCVHDDGGGRSFKCVEIQVVGSDGEVSGILRHTGPQCEARDAVGGTMAETIADVRQFVHDINNLLTVIGSGLREIERQSDAAYRRAIVDKMQHAITRSASLSRQLLDAARPRPKSNGITGSQLALIAGTLDGVLRPDVSVRTEIVPALWTFNADAEELYFALLNLCRNSADAMPTGGVITIVARNIEASTVTAGEFVEIVVADRGEGMPENVLSQAFNPYFTTKLKGSGTGLGLPQVRHFAERQGGAVWIESEPGAGTVVRLFLPRVQPTGLSCSVVETRTSYTPTTGGGVFQIFNTATTAPRS
ncbi:ATP-binding protein [uncultured Bradyrhizobium sp.]|uniref:sensor histidine kinase n=1 Tax=uncultured Bradyrhizobium sp. TaxID=199684 RepID=UPI002604E2CC|nr:ATP-binding protein [uncultured Bradyrhizobium sp.]